jgi:arginase
MPLPEIAAGLSGAGACGVGQERTPEATRAAGLIEHLGRVGFDVRDLGDSPVVPWRPDRVRPRAQNLDAVVETVRTTASRVADALVEDDQIVLTLGGECTVGIGTVAGVQQAIGRVALAYVDLHSDLNTPASATDGALDWMALAHMLAIRGTEPRPHGCDRKRATPRPRPGRAIRP